MTGFSGCLSCASAIRGQDKRMAATNFLMMVVPFKRESLTPVFRRRSSAFGLRTLGKKELAERAGPQVH